MTLIFLITEMLHVFSQRLIKRLVFFTSGNPERMLSHWRSLPTWRFRKLINGTVALAADINNDCSGKEDAVLPSAGGHTGVHCSYLC